MDSIFLYSPRVALVYPIFLINQAFSLKFNRIFKNFLPAKPPFFATSTPRSPPPAPFDKKIIFTHHDRKIPPWLPLRGRFRLLGFGMKNAKKTPQPNHLRPSRARQHAYARYKQSPCIHEDQHSPLLAAPKKYTGIPPLLPAGESKEPAQQSHQPEHLHPQQKQQVCRSRELRQQLRAWQQRQQLPPGETLLRRAQHHHPI